MRNIFSIQAGHAGPTGFQIAPFNRSQTAPWSKYQNMIRCFKSKGSLPYHLGSLIKLLCGQYELGDHYIYMYITITNSNRYNSNHHKFRAHPYQPTRSSLPSVLFGASFARRVVRFCALNLWHRSGTKPLYSTGPLICGTQNSSGREIHSAGSVHWCLGGARYKYPQTALDVKLGRNGKPKPS